MKRMIDSIWFPEKDWNVRVSVHVNDVSLNIERFWLRTPTLQTVQLIALMFQSNGG